MVLVCLVSCSYCYTETITGRTNNAAANGFQWSMTELLPQFTGLTVNSVNYTYTAVKSVSDPFVVNVQNLNATGNGYTFRSRDDWSGLAGNTITKSIALNSIPIQNWGRGEIITEGLGQVTNPLVRYGFTYDTCNTKPITDPRCPGYRPNIPDISITDPLDDEFIKRTLGTKYVPNESEEEQKLRALLKPEPQVAKKAIITNKVIQNALLTTEAAANAAAFEALNNIPNISSYNKELYGGIYPDTLKYVSKALQDSVNVRRLNMSQQQLHNKLTDMQYVNKPQGSKND